MTSLLRSRSAGAAAVLAAAVAFGALALAAPAAAHDQLVSSDPAAGASIDALPEEMTLVFSGELIDAGSGTAVEVLAPSGADVVDGTPEISGPELTVALGDADEAGTYSVTWRIVSSDGHPTDGTFEFDLTGTGADEGSDAAQQQDGTAQDDTAQESPSSSDAAQGSSQDQGSPADGASFLRNAPWIVIGIIVVAAAGAVVALLVGRTRRLGGDDARRDDESDDTPGPGPDRG